MSKNVMVFPKVRQHIACQNIFFEVLNSFNTYIGAYIQTWLDLLGCGQCLCQVSGWGNFIVPEIHLPNCSCIVCREHVLCSGAIAYCECCCLLTKLLAHNAIDMLLRSCVNKSCDANEYTWIYVCGVCERSLFTLNKSDIFGFSAIQNKMQMPQLTVHRDILFPFQCHWLINVWSRKFVWGWGGVKKQENNLCKKSRPCHCIISISKPLQPNLHCYHSHNFTTHT